ncbi:hypothetical protein KHA94_21380 [Bacillus sp. FJAT-49705]|uniref:Spore coat protein Z n=1 Tax=Cytobacillus citreus TaxID=2833586 RepID=A0ABS5NXZ2_9BACI|nr:hypothetical protein [Cytobacillus citreus]MBS4192697.1 hypothetical protein [Cytobacillus citreus]
MNEESLDNVINEGDSETLIEDNCIDLALQPQPAVGPCQCDFDVDYCCVENVPGFFNNNLDPNSQQIFYDPTCLCCTVEECTVQIPCPTAANPNATTPATIFAAVIKGCMPFFANGVFNQPTVCRTTDNARICCQGTVCFDNAVDFGCQEDMEDLCACINALLSDPMDACSLIVVTRNPLQLVNCNNFAIITRSTAGKCTDRFVRFTGKFTIDTAFLQRECNFQRA